MSKFLSFLCLSLLVLLTACKDDDQPNLQLNSDLEAAIISASPDGSLSYFAMPASSDFGSIPQDPKNPLTTEKVELGKMLFHETGLALAPMQPVSSGTYSCASCHFASAGFQAGRFQGIGEGGVGFGSNGEGRQQFSGFDEMEMDVQPLRTPSAMNGAYQELMLWNGQFGATGINSGTEAYWTPDTPIEFNNLGYQGLETQAIAGLKVHRLKMNDTVIGQLPMYKELFDAAFGDIDVENRYNREMTGLAIAAYERTLLANQAPFQQFLAGDTEAMSDEQKRGAVLFFDKANCTTCHTGPALNKMDFAAIGMADLFDCGEVTFKTVPEDPANLGRGSFTGIESDNYKFKIPQLYNLADSPFYGHGSTFESIEEVLVYKNKAIPQNNNVPTEQLDELFVPLELSPTEIQEIASFLREGLRDPNLDRYTPSSLPSGNCFPNNDLLSKIDLGCD